MRGTHLSICVRCWSRRCKSGPDVDFDTGHGLSHARRRLGREPLMCGIGGAIAFAGPFRVDVPYLTRMRDTMSHRGPDGSGLWMSEDARIGLVHRRLSIIDLSP